VSLIAATKVSHEIESGWIHCGAVSSGGASFDSHVSGPGSLLRLETLQTFSSLVASPRGPFPPSEALVSVVQAQFDFLFDLLKGGSGGGTFVNSSSFGALGGSGGSRRPGENTSRIDLL
jgi:hypothetical protein